MKQLPLKLPRLLIFVLTFMAFMPAARALDDKIVIRIYSATDTSAISALVEAFEIANPAIAVAYTEFNTSELYEAMKADPAGADIVISSSMDLQAKLVNDGQAFAFAPTSKANIPDWAQWRGELYGFTFEPVAMVYNRKAFAGRPLPTTRSELASMIRDDPDFFHGRIGTYDINRSGVGYMFATQDAQRGYQFSRIVESFGRAAAKTYCCTSEVVKRVASGELVFGYNVIGSYALDTAKNDPRLGIALFKDYALVMTRTAYIPSGSKHKKEAASFISFLLSDDGQRAIAQHSALLPIAGDIRQSNLGRLANANQALLPIRLGPGLLTYLDTLKKKRFLEDWNASIQGPQNTN